MLYFFDWPTGLERKIPRVLSRVGATQCLSPLSLEDLKLLSPTEGGEELARCLEEVSSMLCDVVTKFKTKLIIIWLTCTMITISPGSGVLICCIFAPQPKVPLIIEVVQSLGVEKSYEIFKQTSEIQSKGGQIAVDGNYK